MPVGVRMVVHAVVGSMIHITIAVGLGSLAIELLLCRFILGPGRGDLDGVGGKEVFCILEVIRVRMRAAFRRA